MAPTSTRYCNRPDEEKEVSTEEEISLENDSEETQQNADNLYVMDKIARYVGLGPRLRYPVRLYGYNKTDDSAEPPHDIPQNFIDAY